LYGTQPNKASFANNILLARKLVEKGVRFVQLFDWGWDSHGTDASLAIDVGFINKCREIDKPITALILDLKQMGFARGYFSGMRWRVWKNTHDGRPGGKNQILLREEIIM